MGDTLELVLILLASAVFVVVLFRWLHLPPLLGYLLVGVAVGPYALAWIPDTDEGRHLAQFGAVLAAASFAGAPWQAALAVGGAIAMSSTAMVMRILAERIQLETPHGRHIV